MDILLESIVDIKNSQFEEIWNSINLRPWKDLNFSHVWERLQNVVQYKILCYFVSTEWLTNLFTAILWLGFVLLPSVFSIFFVMIDIFSTPGDIHSLWLLAFYLYQIFLIIFWMDCNFFILNLLQLIKSVTTITIAS